MESSMDLGMEYEILLLQLGALSRKYHAADETVKEHESQLDTAIKRLEKKNEQLVKLQKESLSNTVLKLFGTYEHVFHRESEDIVSAKLEFDRAYTLKISSARHLLDLEKELEEKKLRLRGVKENLLRRNPELEQTITDQEQTLIHLQYEFLQTVEAEEAAYQVLEAITDILVTLDGNDTISSWDLITEIDLLLNFVNRNQLDAAEAMLLDLERKVLTLDRELHDLNYIYENQYQAISSVSPVIEAFFTDLFSSWSTKDLIERNLQHLKELQENVLQMMDILTARKRELEEEYVQLKLPDMV